MAAHTSGTWTVIAPGFSDAAAAALGKQIVAVTKFGRPICSDADVASYEDEGNARIAAAAPELLSAVRLALTVIDEWIGSEDVTCRDAVEKLRAAIAKAEGREAHAIVAWEPVR